MKTKQLEVHIQDSLVSFARKAQRLKYRAYKVINSCKL